MYVVLVGSVTALSLISYGCLRQTIHSKIASCGLAAVLVIFFAVWVELASAARQRPLLATGLFAAAIALFRLMGRFERPVQPSGRPNAGLSSQRTEPAPQPRHEHRDHSV